MSKHLFEIIFNKSHKKDLAYYYMQIAHDDMGQIRRSTNKRYWTHPQKVCEILEEIGCSDDVCTAALLHDTKEDTEVKMLDLISTFGKEIADLVEEVSNSPDLDGLSKEDYMNKKLLRLSNEELYIKLADIYANMSDSPCPQQLLRMKNNVKYLVKNRDLDTIHKKLISLILTIF
jgi:(p)ppGpp synthase/HD superfamily hydrolase